MVSLNIKNTIFRLNYRRLNPGNFHEWHRFRQISLSALPILPTRRKAWWILPAPLWKSTGYLVSLFSSGSTLCTLLGSTEKQKKDTATTVTSVTFSFLFTSSNHPYL